MVDDASIGLDAGIAILGSHIAFTIGFEQGVGEHRGAGALQIVAITPWGVHHLIPEPRLLVLPSHNGFEVFFQQRDNLLTTGIVLGQRIEHFDECHREPSLSASPAMSAESCLTIGPEHLLSLVIGMTVEACTRVEGSLVSNLHLIDGVVIDGLRFYV